MIAVGAIAAILGLTAACGGLSNNSASSSVAPAASTGVSAGTDATATGIAAATSFLAEYNAPPTALGIDTPLSRTPDAGKTLALLQTPEPISKTKYEATAIAAEALGWEVKIDQGVDGIAIGGVPRSIYDAQLKAAKDKGIFVVQDSTTDAATNGVTAVIDGSTQVDTWGQMNAVWITADSRGSGNVMVFNIGEYPILSVWADGLNAGLAEWCPGCTVTNIDIRANDLVTVRVANLVAVELRRIPDAQYAMFAIGGLTAGVQAAMDAGGITGVKLGGESPDAPNIAALKSGTEALWTGFPTDVLGWRIADAFARAFNGDDLTPANDSLLPTQILTQENIATAPLNDSGTYIGFPDYVNAFTKLWLLR